MQDLEKNIDSYIEHNFHNTFTEGCSTCFAENLIIKSNNECIGCGTKQNVSKCDNTMCFNCWSAETNDGLE